MQYGRQFVREHDTLVQKEIISFLFSVRLFVEGGRLTHIGSCVTFTFKVNVAVQTVRFVCTFHVVVQSQELCPSLHFLCYCK